MKPLRPLLILIISVCNLYVLVAQSYHATHGSPFGGAALSFQNPGSIVNHAFKKDLIIGGFQAQAQTNAVDFLKNPQTGQRELIAREGTFARVGDMAVDFNLFNLLYKINNRQAFSAGFRFRTLTHFQTSPYTFIDTVSNFKEFLSTNESNAYLDGDVLHSGWAEFNFSYAHVIQQTEQSRWSIGGTMHIQFGLSAVAGGAQQLTYNRTLTPQGRLYELQQGGAYFAYHRGYDWLDENTFSSTLGAANGYRKQSKNNIGLSFGTEYLIKKDAEEAWGPLNYNWKFGISLLDIGSNAFEPNRHASTFNRPRPGINDEILSRRFEELTSSRRLRDSLATVFTSTTNIDSTMRISHPTRLVVQIDKALGNNLYINANWLAQFNQRQFFPFLRTRELHHLTITPRWETINWGVFAPIQVTTQQQVWAGLAVKAGPLILGIHNIKNLFDSKEIQGGGYLLLRIQPFKFPKTRTRLECWDE